MKQLLLIIIPVFVFLSGVFAQPNTNFELKKPEKYENMRLASEKTGEKKFAAPRRFIQNTVTHYNYYFNANTRLTELVAQAKASFKDDYTHLLPFYNYDLKTTAGYKTELDSIIYKSTAGILLHDLRNSYIDNLYLIIGQAYYYRNELDSAYITFQYVNYAFSPKEDDGWDKVIGSNSNEGGNIFSVSTKEKKNIVHRALTRPPSRNESFIWQIRTYLARNEFIQASGLIETLKNDPLFPERLNVPLHEVQALLFYKQNMYDSAAWHLERALGNAVNKEEQARWEYLIAQLYDRAGKHPQAQLFYTKATQHTINPLLEVYSILNGLRQGGAGNEKEVKADVDALNKMARKDKYYQYRDIVYYTAANIEQEHDNPEAAKAFLLKSVKSSMNNPDQKSKSYLALGDISFDQQQYVAAKQYYDSVNTAVIAPEGLVKFTALKSALDRIARQSQIVERQDSLNRIAAMPEEDRKLFLKALAKKIRKQSGIKETGAGSGSSMDLVGNSKGPADLFGNTAKGEWYFSNGNLKSKGYTEFRSKWGDRPNSDNWRRSAVASQQFNGPNRGMSGAPDPALAAPTAPDYSYDGLLAGLPLTDDLKKISQDSTEHALFALGKAFQDGLEEYNAAIAAYERLLSTFPATGHAEEAWFNLYYCYGKTGRPGKQQEVKQTLASRYPNGSFNALVNKSPNGITADSLKKNEVTAAYDNIYNLFIEGSFTEALAKKQVADSIYGRNHWTPQLLYIEAVYHIRQREDSVAKLVLNSIIRLYPKEPLAGKSERLLDVLSRRKEIETYLTNLQITRPAEDSAAAIITAPKKVPEPVKKDSLLAVAIPKPPVKDSTIVKEVPEKAISSSVVKNNTDPVRKPVSPITTTRPPSMDTSTIAKKPVTAPSSYTKNPEQSHFVALVMNKVDPVYVSEARNAFNLYNKERYGSNSIISSSLSLTDDIKIVLFEHFENAAAAFQYADNTRKLAAKSIIPWLKTDKYSILIISEENLELLKNRKDYDVYHKFLTEAYPELGF